VGAFPHKYSTAPSGETTDRIKKVRGCKNGTDLLYHHAKYGEDCGSRAGCRPKSVMFFFNLSRFRMTKFVITETLLSTVIVKTIIVSLHRGRFVVVQFSYRPPKFSPRGKFFTKLTIFADFGDRKATFLKLKWSNLAWNCSPGTPSYRQNFVQIE